MYMLCGPAGSGKTTYAEDLVAQGMLKLSIDEDMAQHGKAGEDYTFEEYPALERGVLYEHRKKLVGSLVAGENVVLDYGFGRREERDKYKGLIEDSGGDWRLLYFATPKEVIWERLRERNLRSDANAVPISEELFNDMFSWFEVPNREGEIIIDLP